MPSGAGKMPAASVRYDDINLERSADRRALIEAELAGAGVEALRVLGFDGERSLGVEPTAYRPRRRALVGAPLSAAEIGCVESHRRALRLLVQSDAAFCVVLEDGIALLPGFQDAVAAALGETAGWDMMRLEWRKPGIRADTHIFIRHGHRLVVPKNMT
jgi:GR25 family glycosyltransferase involved in LPS biosynthesis